MDLMSVIDAIPGVGPALPYIAVVVAVCAALATALPKPASGAKGVYPAVYAAINFVAMNFGKARNVAVVLIAVGILGLAACTAEQVAKVQDANDRALEQLAVVTEAVCRVDAQAQPIVVPLTAAVITAVVPSASAAAAGAVALDATVVHPDIVRACAAIGAVAVAAVPAPVTAGK